MRLSTVGYTETETYRCLEDLELTYTMKTMNPLYLAYCGIEKCRPGWKFGPYVRENYLVHIVAEGKGVYRFNGKEYHLSEGDAFLIIPGTETEYQADEELPWTYIWFAFNGYLSETVIDEIGFSEDHPVISLQNIQPFLTNIERIFEVKKLTFSNSMKRTAVFYESLAEMMDLNEQKEIRKKVSDIKYVNMAVELMMASYNKKIKIKEIADYIGINRSYLTSVFKREMHMSPQAFLINYRLEKAAQLLKGTEKTVTDIAETVGYTDALTFSKAFKQKYNISPSRYRAIKPELIQKGHEEGYIHRTKL